MWTAEKMNTNKIEYLTNLFNSWQKFPIVLSIILIIGILWASVQLVHFASQGKSDFGIVFRTALLLKEGAGGEVYSRHDLVTNWPRCIPPAGMIFFQPLTFFSPTVAGIIFAVFTLGVLTGAVIALFKFINRLDYQKNMYLSLFPWALAIFLSLSIGSIQVGQFSVLFAACWIFFMYASTNKSSFWQGLSLSIPSAIKLYPLLIMSVPLFSGKHRFFSITVYFLIGLVLVSVVLPLFFYGTRTIELTESFFKHQILGSKGRVALYQDLRYSSISDQGLDSVLLRYLTYSPDFHLNYPQIPHINVEKKTVKLVSMIVRVMVILISAIGMIRWIRRVKNKPVFSTLMMTAVWSSALYLIIPGVKSRYAVYVVIAFLPLLAAAQQARIQTNWLKHFAWSTTIAICLVLIIQVIPPSIKVFGVGLLGSFTLWITNIKQLFYHSS